MIKYNLVFVEWVDSYGCGAHWGDIPDESVEPKNHSCYSVGWLVRENDDAIVIVPHYSPEDEEIGAVESGCGDMTIPRCAVVHLIDLSINNEHLGGVIYVKSTDNS